MNVTQAVFGVYHHFELAHQLHQRGHLRKIFSTWPWARLKREGLPRELVSTFPMIHTADYLLNRTRFYPEAVSSRMNRCNALTFDRWTNALIGPTDAFIAISGAGLLTGRTVQRRGGKFICDRGSTHQLFQEEVMAEEHRRWGVPLPIPKPHITLREEALYAQADAITVPSTVAKRSFVQMGVPAAKVHVIPYGVRLDKFTPTEPTAYRHQPSRSSSPDRSPSAKASPTSSMPSPALKHPRKTPYRRRLASRTTSGAFFLTLMPHRARHLHRLPPSARARRPADVPQPSPRPPQRRRGPRPRPRVRPWPADAPSSPPPPPEPKTSSPTASKASSFPTATPKP